MSHRRLYLLFLTAMLVVRATSAQQVESELRTLDGVFTDAERKYATHAILTDDGAFFVQRTAGLHRISVASEPIGVASLCVWVGDDVLVLHASAALGSLRFQSTNDGWTTDESFEWAMRDPAMSDEAIAARADYFESHGWVATTSSMGNPGATEFLISQQLLGTADPRFALGVMPSERSDVTLALPSTATGCADEGLVRGYQPESAVRFVPAEWLNLAE